MEILKIQVSGVQNKFHRLILVLTKNSIQALKMLKIVFLLFLALENAAKTFFIKIQEPKIPNP